MGTADEESPIGALSVDISSMGFGDDSQYQNTAEFLAATIGILGLVHLGLEGSTVMMRGDTMSALCWSTTLKFKGGRTANAAVVFTLLLIQARITVHDYQFLSSEQNVRADRLSRGVSVAELSRMFKELSGVKELIFHDSVQQTLADCHPNLELRDDASFAGLWRRVLNTKDLARR